MNTPKQWWAPVWTGLAMDRQGTHCRRMKAAVWLWLYCALNANRKTGALFRKLDTIVADMGVSRGTVIRWLTALRRGGYVETRNTGRYLVIRVRKWKTLGGRAEGVPQVAQDRDTGGCESATSQTSSDGEYPLNQALKSSSPRIF